MILIGLYRYFPHGGLQSDTMRLIQELLSRGEKVCCFTSRWDAPELSHPGFSLECVRPKGFTNHTKMLNFGNAFAKRAEEVRQQGGVALAMNRIPGGDFYFAADACQREALSKKPLWCLKRWLPRYRNIINMEAAVVKDERTKILMISQQQQRDFAQAYPQLDASRVIMLPPGINPQCMGHTITPERRSQYRDSFFKDEQELPIVVCVGNSWKVKGMDRTLEVLARIAPVAPCRVVIVGGVDAGKIYSLAAKYSFPASRLYVAGVRSDIPDLLCSADLMVHLAREEGAGSVLLEAVACGLPVVCTEVCGFSPYISALEPTLVIPHPFDLEAGCSYVTKALQNLPALTQRTREYAAGQDFTGRTKFFADCIIEGQKKP